MHLALGRLNALPAVLLLLAVGAAAPPPPPPASNSTAALATVPFYGNRTTINVCTREHMPFTVCEGRAPQEYSGYEIALFREVMPSLNWTDSMLNWTCFASYASFVDALSGGACDVALAGLPVSKTLLDRNLTFAWPVYTNGKTIAVLTGETTPDIWAFLSVFSWEVWVATLVTVFASGAVIWALDVWSTVGQEQEEEADHLSHLRDMVYTTVGRPMQTPNDSGADSFAGSLVMVCLCFILMVLVAIYTANTAANMTATRLSTEVTSLADLQASARLVGSWEGYVVDLLQRNLRTVGFPMDTAAQERALMDALVGRAVQAVILERATLQAMTWSLCQVKLVGQPFDVMDVAWAFPQGTPPALLAAINAELTALKGVGIVDTFISRYILPPADECNGLNAVSSSTTAVQWDQVAGLWIVMGAAVGAAVLCAAARHYVVCTPAWRRRLRRWRGSATRFNSRLCQTLRAERWCGDAMADASPKGAAVLGSKDLDAVAVECNGGLEGSSPATGGAGLQATGTEGGESGDVRQLLLGLLGQQAELQRQQAALGELVAQLSTRLGGK